MRGISGQHDVAVVPVPVGDRAEVQPSGARAGWLDLPEQRMIVQLALEEFLEKGKATLRRQRVETEAGPRFSRAFDDKCAQSSTDSVAVSPDPAAIGANEGVRE